jgi:hypothetical protein
VVGVHDLVAFLERINERRYFEVFEVFVFHCV